jgi:hypothetical protein
MFQIFLNYLNFLVNEMLTASRIPRCSHKITAVYRVSQEDRSIFWEVIVSVVLSKKKLYTYMCPIQNGFRDGGISPYSTLYTADEQHGMFSHELQSAFMLTVEFSKMYYAR